MQILTRKVVCENCEKEISYANYSKHLKACMNGYSVKKHRCSDSSCDTMIKIKSNFCQFHYLELLKSGKVDNSANFGDSVKLGALITNHNRWHVKRNKISETCELCQKDLIK